MSNMQTIRLKVDESILEKVYQALSVFAPSQLQIENDVIPFVSDAENECYQALLNEMSEEDKLVAVEKTLLYEVKDSVFINKKSPC